MTYYRTSLLNPDIVNFSNENVLENEICLGRWLVDSISLLLSKNESYSLNEVFDIQELDISYIPTIYLNKGCMAPRLEGSTIIERRSFYNDKKRSEWDYQTRESILTDLGLNVIWYKGDNDHQELYDILEEIRRGKTN